jgi:D-3-phosphoglycerate dehydrogenase
MFAMTEGFTRGGSRLRVIGVPAGKKIDEPYIDAATKQGILIVRTYDNGEISKESLLIEHIAEHAVEGKEFRGTELEGRTIGFLGVGPSSLNAAIWCREFGMKTIGCDVFLSGKSVAEKGLIPATLSDLLSTSDFLVIDTPLTDCTMPLVNADLIHYCRPGAQIINASRAEVVHEPSLLRALQKGHVHSASLDLLQVASKESATGALRSHPRVRVAKIPGSATFDLQEDFYRQFDANIFGSDKVKQLTSHTVFLVNNTEVCLALWFLLTDCRGARGRTKRVRCAGWHGLSCHHQCPRPG